jgi:CheY-like chemotaxis protein
MTDRQGKVVLLVEDDHDARTDNARLLRAEGYMVIEADDGDEALSIARGQTVDLILMDLELPMVDGLDTTRKLKQDARTDRIPIIIASASGSVDESRAAGADAFIGKPFSSDHLLEIVAWYFTVR